MIYLTAADSSDIGSPLGKLFLKDVMMGKKA